MTILDHFIALYLLSRNVSAADGVVATKSESHMSLDRMLAADDPSSFLVVVLDVDIGSWLKTPAEKAVSVEESRTALQKTVENLLLFINTFLLLHERNRVGVIVFGRHGFEVAYPCVRQRASGAEVPESVEAEDDAFEAASNPSLSLTAPEEVLRILPEAIARVIGKSLEAQACSEKLSRGPHVSSALATALCMINRRHVLKLTHRGVLDASKTAGSDRSVGRSTQAISAIESISSFTTVNCQARILVILASDDVPDQYVPVMNCISSAQRMRIPIDTFMLLHGTDSTYFQQAAHLTSGIYLRPLGLSNQIDDSLQQYLSAVFLPDSLSREYLAKPVQGEVDFRATCFKTRQMIEEGYTCSVCLSTFDISVGKGAFSCPTCRARFALPAGVGGAPRRPPTESKPMSRV